MTSWLPSLGIFRRAFGGEPEAPEASDTAAAGRHIWCLAVHGERLFAGAADGGILVFSLPATSSSSTICIGTVHAHEGTVYALHVHGTKLISSGGDGTIRIWTCPSHSTADLPMAAAEATASDLPVLALAGIAADVIFSGAADGHVRRWIRASDDEALRCSHSALAHAKTCFGLAMVSAAARASVGAQDVGVASVGGDALIRLWHANDLQPLITITCERVAAPLADSSDCTATAPSVPSTGDLQPSCSNFCITATVGAATGRIAHLLVGGTDQRLRRVSVQLHSTKQTALSVSDGMAAWFLPSRASTVSGPNGSSPESEGPQPFAPLAGEAVDLNIGSLRGHTAFISAVTAVAINRAVSADLQGFMVMWDVDRRQALRSWSGHAKGIYALASCSSLAARVTDADGCALLPMFSCSSDGNIKLWRLLGPEPSSTTTNGSTSLSTTPALDDLEREPTSYAAPSAATSLSNRFPEGYAALGRAWQVASSDNCVWCLQLLCDTMLACGTGDGTIHIFQLCPDGIVAGSTCASGKAGDHCASGGSGNATPSMEGGLEVAQLYVTLHGHTGAVQALALGDGQLASASADGSLRLWEMTRFQCTGTLLGHIDRVLCCGFAFGSSHTVDPSEDALLTQTCTALFSADAKGQLVQWQACVGGIYSIAAQCSATVHGEVYALVCVDSVVITASADHRVRLWSAADLTKVAILDPATHKASVFALAVLPADAHIPRRIASADAHGRVAVWQLADRAIVQSLTSDGGSICALAASHDGALHAAGGRGHVMLWNNRTISSTMTTTKPLPPDTHTKVHPSGVLALACSSTASADACLIFSGSMDGLVSAHSFTDKAMSSHTFEGTSLLDETSAIPTRATATLSAHQGCVWSLASNCGVCDGGTTSTPQPLLCSGAADQRIRIWTGPKVRLQTADYARSPDDAEDSALTGEWTLQAELDCAESAAATDTVAPIEEAAINATVYALLLLPTAQQSSHLPDDMILLAALANGTVQMWLPFDHNSASGEIHRWSCVQRCIVHTGSILCLAACEHQIYCGSSDCGIIRLSLCQPESSRNLSANRLPVHDFRLAVAQVADCAHSAEVHALAFCANGRLVSASADGMMRIWAASSLTLLYTLRSRGRMAALAHDGAVYALVVVPASTTNISSLPRTSHNERIISAGADQLIKAWDAMTMDHRTTLRAHRSFVCALAADINKRRLYSASSDQTCAVWQLDTYDRLHVLSGHCGGLYSLILHDGWLCTGSLDETVRVWNTQAL